MRRRLAGACWRDHPRVRRHRRGRRARAAAVPHDERLLRRRPHRHRRVERLGHQRRIPLCRVLPRRRRHRLLARHRHAVAAGRLHDGLPRPARPRRRPTAALRRLHDPRLRRGCGCNRDGSAASPACSWSASAGSICSRSSRARASPCDRHRRPPGGRQPRRRSRRAGSASPPAGCARSPGAGMQYWLKLAAIAIPCFVLLWLWLRDGQPLPQLTSPGGPFAGARYAAYPPANTRSTRPTRRSSPCASARWGCRTCSCASTPTPTAGPRGARRSSSSACSASSTSSRRSSGCSAASTSRACPPAPAPTRSCCCCPRDGPRHPR
jgi:hypothetical protein